MRFRFSSFLKCFAIVGMATLVSCSKDDGKDVPDVVQGAFEISGQKYNTLQDAVNAAIASEDDETVITLTATTSGDGFTAKDGHVNIDFGSYMYYLNPGKTLSLDNSYVAMTGKGGELVGEGTIIKGNDSGLSFEGNLNIEGDMEVTTMDYFGFIEDYSGVYSGNVNLTGSYMYVKADKAVLNIKTLTPVLSELYVAKAQSVTIDNVVGKDAHAVTSDVAGIVTVKNGAEVHVHTYGAGEPMSCSNPMHMIKVCTACDHFIDYVDENGTKAAACDPEYLMHYDAVKETETEWGHVEYWECIECGKFYADKDAKVLLEPQLIMISPASELDLSDFDDEFATAATRGGDDSEDPSIGDIIEGIGEAASAIEGIVNFFNGQASEETLFMDMFIGLDVKLDQINEKLDRMKTQISSLNSQIDKKFAEGVLYGRIQDMDMLDLAKNRFKSLIEKFKPYAGKKSLTPEELATLKGSITTILNGWNAASENINRSTMTLRLALNYAKIDDTWRLFLRSGVIWEHETFGARQIQMRRDIATVELAALMSSCYLAFAKDYGNISESDKKEEIDRVLGELIRALGTYQGALKNAINAMKEESKYLYLSDTGHNNPSVKIDKNMANFDIYNRIKDNVKNVFFDRDSHNSDNTSSIASDVLGIDEIFDQGLIQRLMSHFKTNNPVEALRKSGFNVKTPVCISLHHLRHSCGDGKAECRNFRWASYSGSSGEDWIYFRGILRDEYGKGIWWETRFMYDANIKNDGGKISSLGKRPKGLLPNGLNTAVILAK